MTSGFGTTVSSSQAYIALRSFLGAEGPTQQTLLNFQTSDSFSAAAQNAQTISIAANTTGQELDLATMFPAFTAPLFVFIADITQPGIGFKWYSDSGDTNKQVVGPSNFICWMPDGATALNPIYIDNPSATNALILQIGVLSN